MSHEINLLESNLETTTTRSASARKLVDVLQQVKDRDEERQQLDLGRKQAKRVIEGLLFACSDPLSIKKIREVTDSFYPLKPRIIQALIGELAEEYDREGRAFEIQEIGGGYVVRTRLEYGKYIELLFRNKRGEKLSGAATEVLAIIAYRQPITRIQVDVIRGVDSSGTVYALMERGLIECVGRLEAPGRPALYGTTTNFLKAFGLRSPEDLPHRDQLVDRAEQLPDPKKGKKANSTEESPEETVTADPCD